MSLEKALHLADQGYPVFPVRGKRPVVREWQKRATTDPSRVERLWNDAPGADGVGIATGDGLVVIDLDVKGGTDGVQSFTDWAAEHGLEWTSTTRTASGGAHVYLRATEAYRNRAGMLPGVDVRADGGYVVAYDAVPPLTDLPQLTEPLARLLPSRSEKDDQGAAARAIGPAGVATAFDFEVMRMQSAQDGERNHVLNATAYNLGQLVGDHLDEDEVREALTHAALEAGLEPDEITTTLESGLNDGMRNPRTVVDQQPVEPGAWTPVNIAEVLAGGLESPEPAFLTRTDGQCLLYPGLTHSISGESGSGKSWLAQWATAEAIHADHRTLYLDYEASAGQVVHRLLTLGCTPEQLTAQLVYVNPDDAPQGVEFAALLDGQYGLAVVDGVTEALGISGIVGESLTNNNDAVTRWHKLLPKRIATETGAAVVQVDHVTKAKDSRGAYALGGQAKRASLTGASYIVQPRQSFGQGRSGSFDLFVGKDRPGAVLAGDGEDTTSGRRVACVEVHSTGDRVRLELKPHSGSTRDARLDDMKATITAFLGSLGPEHQGAGVNLIRKGVEGRTGLKDQALKELVADGHVIREPRGQSMLHRLGRPYTEFEELL